MTVPCVLHRHIAMLAMCATLTCRGFCATVSSAQNVASATGRHNVYTLSLCVKFDTKHVIGTECRIGTKPRVGAVHNIRTVHDCSNSSRCAPVLRTTAWVRHTKAVRLFGAKILAEFRRHQSVQVVCTGDRAGDQLPAVVKAPGPAEAQSFLPADEGPHFIAGSLHRGQHDRHSRDAGSVKDVLSVGLAPYRRGPRRGSHSFTGAFGQE